MIYNANTARASVTLPTLSLYAAICDHWKQALPEWQDDHPHMHQFAMLRVRRAMIRAAVKADMSVMREVHDAIREALANPDNAKVQRRVIVRRAAWNALNTAVRVAPATMTPDGLPYASGMVRAALQVARKTLARACEHGGTDTQRVALQDLDRVNAAAVRYDVAGYDWDASTPAVLAVLADVGHDAQDMYAAAMQGIVSGYTFDKGTHKGEALHGTATPDSTPREHVRAAYLTANKAMHAQRAAAAREMWTEYIREEGGDLVAVGVAIARIIKGGECWTETDEPAVSRVDVDAIREHLPRALSLCRPVQREVAGLLARGYSVEAIARKLERDRRTVQRNIAIMRGTCTEYIRENAPSLLPMFNAEKYTAQAMETEAAEQHKKGANSRRTEAGEARCKATQAARARAYRERKKAADALAALLPILRRQKELENAARARGIKDLTAAQEWDEIESIYDSISIYCRKHNIPTEYVIAIQKTL